MTINQENKITISGLAMGGAGIGKLNNYAVFVPGAVPDDELEIALVQKKKNYAIGKIMRILKPSPDRTTPKCPLFNQCGGCQWQHIDYPAQLKYKKQLVADSLERIGKITGMNIADTIGMDDPWHYRNKVQYPVAFERGEAIIGYYQERTHHVINIEECPVAHPDLTRLMNSVRKIIRKYRIRVYNEGAGRGLLRHLIGRIGFATNEMLLGLVINGAEIPDAGRMTEELTQLCGARLVGILQNINRDQTNVILGAKSEILFGDPQFIEQLGALRFKIALGSFFQINPVQTVKLYNKIIELAELSGKEIVVDAYAGVGPIALWIAPHVRKIIGIEENTLAVADAKDNARLNKLKSIEFIEGRVEAVLPKIEKPDVLILDPPRSGCSASVSEAILQISPKKIIYVSCDATTLARDLRIFLDGGYKLEIIQPIDMFPHTYHVETIVRLGKQ